MRKLGCLILLIALAVAAVLVATNLWVGTGPAERPDTGPRETTR